MKIINQLLRWSIGGLFIFSGMIKVNDPVGTAIKLKEYFEVFSDDISSLFHVFIPYALPIAVILVVLEVVLGIALLVRFKTKTVLWALFGMILFFTFLTFYSAYFNKVTDCGCFGDAIKLTPWESFTKDVVLLTMISILLLQIRSFHNKALQIPKFITIGSLVASTFIAIMAIRHLPFIDFRPYAIGDNIEANMKPEEAPVFEYVFEKKGEKITSSEWLTEENGYKYVEAVTTNPDKSTPRITDYSVVDSEGNEVTDITFTGKRLLIVIENTAKADIESIAAIKTLLSGIEGKYVPMLFTADVSNIEEFRHKHQLAVPYYSADATVLKAMIRSNPGIMVLEEGTVKGKWHYNDVPSAEEVLDLK